MGMAILVCTMVALLLLFILSRSPKTNHSIHRRLRSNSPLSDDNFNATNRIVRLFPEIDVDPTDWFVSLHELTQWNLHHAQMEVLRRSQREMDVYDTDRDGFVSFSEYSTPTRLQRADRDSFGYDMSWWKEEHFNASDVDGNGLLNLAEFNDERDMDRDGKVNFKEFFHGLFDLVRNSDKESYNVSHHFDDSKDTSARQLFDKLDKDGDRYLSDIELLPIIGKLHPSGTYYAKLHAEYLISQAEVDKDGRLTLTEMIKNPYVFYSAFYNNDHDEIE